MLEFVKMIVFSFFIILITALVPWFIHHHYFAKYESDIIISYGQYDKDKVSDFILVYRVYDDEENQKFLKFCQNAEYSKIYISSINKEKQIHFIDYLVENGINIDLIEIDDSKDLSELINKLKEFSNTQIDFFADTTDLLLFAYLSTNYDLSIKLYLIKDDFDLYFDSFKKEIQILGKNLF